MSNWMILFVAGALEVCWAVGLKYTKGWTDAKASVLTLAAMVASMYLLGVATRTLPIGTAYAVWTGIGAIGTALLGMMLFGESSSAVRLLSIGLILAGIAGLKLTA